MKILIKSALIIDPQSKYHQKKMDILVKDGKIQKIKKSIKIDNKSKITEYKQKNLHVSPGWFDIHVNFCEPGYEEKETILTGSNAAIKGGFTGVMLMPNTKPYIDNKGILEFIKNISKKNIIDIHVAGNITKKCEGNDIVEMYDMYKSGCKAFTDDKNSLNRNDVMKIAMLYSKDADFLIMNYACDTSLAKGHMNEGEISTRLGLKGIPSVAEEIMVDRDLNLCKYTNSKLHLSYISTKESINKIKKAKSLGLKVSSDVAIHNLFLTEDLIKNFDTRYKVSPPLRTKVDNSSLINGLKNDVIDIISSDHTPINEEYKKTEFDNAESGIIGLESAFGLLGKHVLHKIGISKLIEKISINPRKILNIEEVIIEEGKKANMTLFDPEIDWVFNEKDIKSKSKNTPFIGEKLKGKALAVINNGELEKC